MSTAFRKTEIEPIDGTPEKRLFLSIISDYDLQTGLCELVDNAIDFFQSNKRIKPLKIEITLDIERQIISVNDNAGGVKHEDLRRLVAPGGSRNDPRSEVIGIFGVGSKRAGIALGELVEIRTRFGRQRTLGLDISREWLEASAWEIAAYEFPDIPVGTTRVVISKLRRPFDQEDVGRIVVHLAETYDWFLRQGYTIEVNGEPIKAKSFDAWAYPPGFLPRSTRVNAEFGKDGKIAVEIRAGLIRDRDPETDNYGVYFYCNNRLIVKELRTREVGYFVSSEAGVPHPDASLCRVIVKIRGPAQLMPWNSTKNGINFGHPAFQAVRPTVIQFVSYFSKLSRRLKNDWDSNVFRYPKGSIEPIESEDITKKGRLVLPALPRGNTSYVEQVKARNAGHIRNEPWTLGLLEAMAAVEVLIRQRLDIRNRLALILLDSNFEISMKEFIIHRTDLFPPQQYGDAQIKSIFARRQQVISEVSGKIAIPKTLLAKTAHYYNLRNKLIHERATVGVTDTDVQNYRSTIEKILKILFDLRFTKA